MTICYQEIMKTTIMNKEIKMEGMFYGSKSFGLKIFKTLKNSVNSVRWSIVHPNDEFDERSSLKDFSEYSSEEKINFYLVNDKFEAKNRMIEIKPDVIFVCGWYWLFDIDFLLAPKFGVFGIHNSLLPLYRGGSPLVWSMINGDDELGASVFQLTPGMDEGDILLQVKVKNCADDNISTILDKIEKALFDRLPQKWNEVISGNAVLIKQESRNATYCGQRIPEDGKIEWKVPAQNVHNFIRAQSHPYPGSFSFLGKSKITFLQSRVYQGKYYGSPGQILRRMDDSIIVSCGENTAIIINKVSFDGNPQNPAKLIKSTSIRFS